MGQPFFYENLHAKAARTFEGFQESLELSWLFLKPNIKWIAIFGVVTHPLFFLTNNALGNGDDSLTLRLLAFFACVMGAYLPQIERSLGARVAAWLSTSMVFFALPFFFLWVLAQNSLNESIGASELASRQLQCAFAIMATALLIYDRLVLVIGLLVCFALVSIFFYATAEFVNLPILWEGLLAQTPFWLFGVVAGTYFNRNRAVVEREKYKTLSDTGGHLAHELRTPLAAISLKLHGLNRFLDEQKRLAASDDEIEKNDALGLVDRLIARTEGLSKGAIEDVVYANELIDMFLVRAGKTNNSVEMKIQFLASKCVEEAYGRYPFASTREKGSTRIKLEDDFLIDGPYVLMTHVILNLLKNALAYAPANHNPEVVIRVYRERKLGCIDVIDNGPGISTGDQNKIFESFYTTTSAGEGAGIGLHFCRSVVTEMGGTITVHSIPNVQTVFRIRTRIST